MKGRRLAETALQKAPTLNQLEQELKRETYCYCYSYCYYYVGLFVRKRATLRPFPP